MDVHVDVTTATTQPADITARAVLTALQDTLTARDLVLGQLTVTVLRLQR